MTGFLVVLALFAITGSVLFICYLAASAFDMPDRPLPGSLGESDWPELDDWERHVQSTPGVGELEETPIFDALCFEAWEAQVEEDVS